ncbi:hypothetical protein [Mucilaginibacter auburnensis]|uniref:hypothetical protein n=1 Tax=Mucilaginibacter auburnensis TaxID=1457233 RepID=UPI000C23C904|nr:hypothetical protein [Mucilaginibacter auburnensis]
MQQFETTEHLVLYCLYEVRSNPEETGYETTGSRGGYIASAYRFGLSLNCRGGCYFTLDAK